MRILNVSADADTAGSGWLTAQAFLAERPDWAYRAARRTDNYIRYPVDLPWPDAREAWRQSDVVVVQNDFSAETALRIRCRRPLVLAHHGSIFRRRRVQLLREQRRRGSIGTVSTLDLWLTAPDELVWSPLPVDIDALAGLRLAPREAGPLRIAHAPTNRAVKSTEAFLAAVSRLGRELPVELVLIEGQRWSACLEAKARADVYFDQVALGYGMNAVEAWAMRIPVIAGGADGTLEEIERRAGSLPFLAATESSIYASLRALVDATVRDVWAERGLAFARRFHSQAAVVTQLQGLFAGTQIARRAA